MEGGEGEKDELTRQTSSSQISAGGGEEKRSKCVEKSARQKPDESGSSKLGHPPSSDFQHYWLGLVGGQVGSDNTQKKTDSRRAGESGCVCAH